MIIFVFDNTFEGLLTAVYEAYYTNARPDRIVTEVYHQPNLVDAVKFIETDEVKSNKVYDAIVKKVSKEALRHVYHAFLSETVDAPTIIYRYLTIAFKMGQQVDHLLTNKHILEIHKISKKVTREKHRMLGLVRFQLIKEDLYYASIEPDHHIVGLLAPHFAKRMADQNWIIHDKKRDTAAIFDKSQWFIAPLQYKNEITNNNEEALYQELWKTYFKNIAIKERKNSKLQRSFMPTRYWKHLTEKS
ncbi:DNA metabolism protein [Alkaliphilus pronyensis]|uniref:DNA metabolism protein n=1 Tax=Alkaliphilus pronyensis TaxID=1482732 RepID=A0A6I0EYK4_9FIRM|nr:TIGR03915 family putative DNA repair protein [Alkaliphilus pronyensis]KAB3534708.1 DNA metabolism protein [Alkaliphilus pronyensis]